MKVVPITTCTDNRVELAGVAHVEIGDDKICRVLVDIYPGSALFRSFAVLGKLEFSIDFDDIQESIEGE